MRQEQRSNRQSRKPRDGYFHLPLQAPPTPLRGSGTIGTLPYPTLTYSEPTYYYYPVEWKRRGAGVA